MELNAAPAARSPAEAFRGRPDVSGFSRWHLNIPAGGESHSEKMPAARGDLGDTPAAAAAADAAEGRNRRRSARKNRQRRPSIAFMGEERGPCGEGRF
jgi:hypothetical protein